MKHITLIVFLLISTIGYSQFGNRNFGSQRQRQMMDQSQRPAPEINYEVEKYLGIVIYDDIEKAAKKSSVKLSSDTGKAFEKEIKAYNKKVSELRRINSFTLKSVKEMVENFQREARKTGDLSGKKEVQETMSKELKPIADALKAEDLVFDKKMRALLSEKQYKKWTKYNRGLYKVFPDPTIEEE